MLQSFIKDKRNTIPEKEELMTEKTPQNPSTDQVLQSLLDKLTDPCVPYDFGDRLAEESVEKYFPKW